MRPSAFEYTRATSVVDALRAMSAGAIPLAGGQSLIQAMRMRESEPQALVDLGAVEELSATIEVQDEHIHIGARVTHRSSSEDPFIAAEMPWLTQAVAALGDVQVRNLGTVLGNLCWADPRANMAVALLAADAVIHAISPHDPNTVERIPIDAFFTGFRETALNGRLATGIEVPRRPGARGCYIEFARQRQDLALCNVCVVMNDDRTAARIAVGGIDRRPLRLIEVEEACPSGDPARIERALDVSLNPQAFHPIEDHYGTPDYKLGLARTLVGRALAAIDDGRKP